MLEVSIKSICACIQGGSARTTDVWTSLVWTRGGGYSESLQMLKYRTQHKSDTRETQVTACVGFGGVEACIRGTVH